MKKILICVLVLVLSLGVFAGCGEASGEDEKVLYMYTEAGFAPFEYTVGTEIVGVDVDIAKLIAEELGWTLEIKDVPFASIVSALSEDNVIGAAGMTIDADKSKNVDFSIPYVDSVQTLLVLEGTEVETIAEGKVSQSILKDKKLGVQSGTMSDILLKNTVKPDETVKQYDQYVIGMLDLNDGTIDGLLVDITVAEQLMKKSDVKYDMYTIENTEEKYGIAVKKGNTELLATVNKVLEELLSTGKIDEFIKTHKDA